MGLTSRQRVSSLLRLMKTDDRSRRSSSSSTSGHSSLPQLLPWWEVYGAHAFWKLLKRAGKVSATGTWVEDHLIFLGAWLGDQRSARRLKRRSTLLAVVASEPVRLS